MTRWTHPSGFTVAHCGHPTALRPYYLLDPAGTWVGQWNETTRKGRPMGLTFPRLREARAWLESHLHPTIELDEETLAVSRSWTLVLPPDFRWDR